MLSTSNGTTAAICAGTPGVQVLDNRGLAVRVLQYNRRVAGEDAEQLLTRQRYTPTGQLLSSLDPRLGAAQQLDPTLPPNFLYLASLSGRPLRSQSQDAGTTVQLSDVEGGPVWQRGSRQQRTRWSYDALHRPTAMVEQAAVGEPERISERYSYADGSAVAAAANGRGRLLAHCDTAGLNETPRYSLSGQVQLSVRRLLRAEVSASDWQGEAPAWEAALEDQAYTSRQGFDALGRVAWTLDAKGNRQHAQFNVAGQLLNSQLTLAGQTSPRGLLRSVRYSAAGQVQQEVAGNGVVSDYGYEAQTQRLNRLTVTRPAQSGRNTLLQDLAYDYDPVGNILAIGDAAQATRYYHNQRIAPANQYQYDALYQLLNATGRENADAGQQGPGLPIPQVPLSTDPNRYSNYTRRYSYDRGGNLTQIRHQGNQNYTQDLVVAPTSNRAVQQTGFLTPADVDGHFDAAGNLRQLAPGQPLTWDGRNQLQEVRQVQRDTDPDDREWYRYDGAGQRVQKTSVSQTSGTQRQAEVIYLPGLELRRTLSSQDGVSRTVEDLQVIRGQAAGRAQVRVLHWESGQPADLPNDQVRYSLDNQIGSSLLELDQAADILTLEEYFPYGGTAVWSGKSSGETQYKFVRYSGKERDATGLYYYGFRYYLPWLGRWLNPDPAGTVDGLNLFRMVRNNPVTLADSMGLAPEYQGKGDIFERHNKQDLDIVHRGRPEGAQQIKLDAALKIALNTTRAAAENLKKNNFDETSKATLNSIFGSVDLESYTSQMSDFYWNLNGKLSHYSRCGHRVNQIVTYKKKKGASGFTTNSIAFVHGQDKHRRLWLNERSFFGQRDGDAAETLIHEVSHVNFDYDGSSDQDDVVMFGTKDYWYYTQSHIKSSYPSPEGRKEIATMIQGDPEHLNDMYSAQMAFNSGNKTAMSMICPGARMNDLLVLAGEKESSGLAGAFINVPELRIWTALANADTAAYLAFVLAGDNPRQFYR